MAVSKRKRMLLALIYKDCATAILTEVYDGVLNRLEDGAGALPTEAEAAWIHEVVGGLADKFIFKGQRQEQ